MLSANRFITMIDQENSYDTLLKNGYEWAQHYGVNPNNLHRASLACLTFVCILAQENNISKIKIDNAICDSFELTNGFTYALVLLKLVATDDEADTIYTCIRRALS